MRVLFEQPAKDGLFEGKTDNYITVAAEKVKEDVITNHVDFESVPYKEYDHTKLSADVKSRPEIKRNFKLLRQAD
mgnify:FL=1